MFPCSLALQLVTSLRKPVAPANASIYHDALGFTAKKATSTAHLHQSTKPKGDWVFLAKERQDISELS
jgi:hypothetical protein